MNTDFTTSAFLDGCYAYALFAAELMSHFSTEVYVVVAMTSVMIALALDRRGPRHHDQASNFGYLAVGTSIFISLVYPSNALPLFSTLVRSSLIGAIVYGATRSAFGLLVFLKFLLADCAPAPRPTNTLTSATSDPSEFRPDRSKFAPTELLDPVVIDEETPDASNRRLRVQIARDGEKLQTVFDSTSPWSLSDVLECDDGTEPPDSL